MDWKLRYPCCFEIRVCVGCWSQTVKTYLQNIQEKGMRVCVCVCACVFVRGRGAALNHARIQSIKGSVFVPIRKYMERGESGASVFLHAGMSTGLFHFHFPSSSPHTPHLKVFFYYTGRLSKTVQLWEQNGEGAGVILVTENLTSGMNEMLSWSICTFLGFQFCS